MDITIIRCACSNEVHRDGGGSGCGGSGCPAYVEADGQRCRRCRDSSCEARTWRKVYTPCPVCGDPAPIGPDPKGVPDMDPYFCTWCRGDKSLMRLYEVQYFLQGGEVAYLLAASAKHSARCLMDELEALPHE